MNSPGLGASEPGNYPAMGTIRKMVAGLKAFMP